MWRQLVRLLLFPGKLLAGYDVFVSYRRQDGAAYAEALLSSLSLKVAPRADFQDTDPGERLPLRLRISIALTRVLVVVSTPGANDSPHVDAEVLLFLRCGGSPLRPIELSYPVEKAAWYRHYPGVPVLYETEEARVTETPSDRVVERILDNVGFWKRSRRQAALSVMFGVVLVAVTVFGISLQNRLADALRKTVEAEKKQAQVEDDLKASQKKAAQETNIAESRRLAQLAGLAGNVTAKARLALQALEAAASNEAIQAAIQADKDLTLRRESPSVMDVDASGRFAAVADFFGNATVMDLADGRTFSLCGYAEQVENLRFSPDGRYLASLRGTGPPRQYIVEIWDVRSGQRTGSLEVPYSQGFGFAFFFSPDGSRLVLASSPTRLLSVPSAALIRSVDEADIVIFDASSRTMLTSRLQAGETTPAIWRTDDGNRVWTFPSKYYRWISFHPANSSLIAGLESKEPRFFVLRIGRDGMPVDPREAGAEEVGREGLLQGEAQEIGSSQFDIGRFIQSLFPATRCSLVFSDHTAGRSICEVGQEAVSIFDPAAKIATPLKDWGTNDVFHAEFSPDDSRLATAFFLKSASVSLWDTASGERLWETSVPDHDRMRFSGNGNRLVLWSPDGNVSVLDARTKKRVARMVQADPHVKPGLPYAAQGVLWISPDGRQMITRTYHALRLWDVDRGRVLREMDLKTPDEAKATQEMTLLNFGSPSGEQLRKS